MDFLSKYDKEHEWYCSKLFFVDGADELSSLCKERQQCTQDFLTVDKSAGNPLLSGFDVPWKPELPSSLW